MGDKREAVKQILLEIIKRGESLLEVTQMMDKVDAEFDIPDGVFENDKELVSETKRIILEKYFKTIK